MSSTGGPFGAHSSYLGREAELELLQARLDEARGGRGGLVLVRAAGGMGATRTAHELAARADRAGMLVLWGACREGTTDRPLGALADALEEYGGGLAPAELAAQLADAAPVLSRLAPRLGLKLSELTPAAPLDAPSEQRRLQTSVLSFISRMSDSQPLLLVLDDIQWADGDALLLLRHLARRAPGLPVLALANELRHPAIADEPADAHESALRDALAREPDVLTVELAGLDEGATGAMIAALASEPLSPATVALVQQVSGGEPLWARELYRHLQEENRLEGSAGRGLPSAADLPETLEQLLAWRMSRLGPEVRTALTALAAFGDDAQPALLAEVTGLSRGRLVDYLELGVARGLCRTTAGGQHYAVTHDRLRRAMLAGLAPPQRAQLHRRAAQALEAELGELVREQAGRMLHHYRSSAALDGAERGLRHGLLAAEQARAAYATLRQVRCLEDTRRLVAGTQPEMAADLQARLARAQAEAGLFEAALASAGAALRARRRLNQSMSEPLEQLIGTLRVLRGDGLTGDRQAALEAMRREGLEHSARTAPLTRARLELLAEHWQPLESGSLGALTWSEVPAADVRPLADEGREADLAELLLVQRMRTRDDSARAAGHARRWRGPAPVLRAMRAVAFDLLSRHGLFREAASWAVLYVSTAERYGAPSDMFLGRLLLGRAQAVLGMLEGAAESLAKARAGLAEAPADGWLANELLLSELVLAHFRDGDWPALADRLADASSNPSPHGLALGAERCLALARSGSEQAARGLLPEVLDGCAALAPLTYYRDTALLGALAAAWELGAAEHAARGRQLLELAAGAGAGGQPAGTLRLARARMYGLSGEVEEAVALLAEERPALEAAGLRCLLAIADHDEALILAASGGVWLAEAPPLLERAAEQFLRLGMPGWLERVRRLLESGLDSALRPGGRLHFTYPLGLSRREADLVRLLSAGTPLASAAQSMGVDEAAASRHLDSALEKLSVSLEELPRAARRHGLGGGV